MAVLADTDRAELWAEYMRNRSHAGDSLGSLSKVDLRAAVNAIDDYFNTNAAAMNTAIPQPARTALTSAQKALLFMYVIEKRYLTGA